MLTRNVVMNGIQKIIDEHNGNVAFYDAFELWFVGNPELESKYDQADVVDALTKEDLERLQFSAINMGIVREVDLVDITEGDDAEDKIVLKRWF